MTNSSENNANLSGVNINDEPSIPDSLKESISALMDSETTEMEVHRVLKASESNLEVTALWSRYQTVSSSIRNTLPESPMVDLSGAIRASLENDETYSSSKRNWASGLLKTGIAASVAVVMVLTAQLIGIQTADINGHPGVLSESVAVTNSPPISPVSLPAGFQAPSINARVVSSHPGMPVREAQPRYYPVVTQAQTATPSSAPSAEVQAYLQRVMEVHAGNAALNSGRGLLPYARVPVANVDQP